MIVEDEAVIALGLEQRLTEIGYDVIGTFHSGEAAVENARSLSPDLILMDIMMPGDLDGIDVAKNRERGTGYSGDFPDRFFRR